MKEGLVQIFLSYKEPEDKDLLWLRPHIGPNAEGYDLLYFGAKGWTPLIVPCEPHFVPPPRLGPSDDDCCFANINPDKHI